MSVFVRLINTVCADKSESSIQTDANYGASIPYFRTIVLLEFTEDGRARKASKLLISFELLTVISSFQSFVGRK